MDELTENEQVENTVPPASLDRQRHKVLMISYHTHMHLF